MFDDDSSHALAAQLTLLVEATGSTDFFEVGDTYFLYPEGAAPLQLKASGAAVMDGQLGAWQPIAAEQAGSGLSGGLESFGGNVWIWDVDSGGNYVSNAVFAHGGQWALQSAETSFGQDLSGDGFVGPITTAIEASGATRLYDVADAYFLYPEGGSPVGLKVGGAMVAEGQLGAWQPIAAEQVGRAIRWPGSSAATSGSGTSTAAATTSPTPSSPTAANGRCNRRSRIRAGPEWRRFRRTHYDGDRSVRSDTPVRCGGRLFPVSGGGSPVVSRSAARWWRKASSAPGSRSQRSRSDRAIRWPGSSPSNIWIWDVDSGGNYVSNAVFAHGSQWALQSAEPDSGRT